MIKCYGGDHPMEHGLISCIWIWHNAIFRSYNMLHTVCSIHKTLMLWQHACFWNIPFWKRLVARPESSFGFDIFPPIITTLQISSSDLTFSKSQFIIFEKVQLLVPVKSSDLMVISIKVKFIYQIHFINFRSV